MCGTSLHSWVPIPTFQNQPHLHPNQASDICLPLVPTTRTKVVSQNPASTDIPHKTGTTHSISIYVYNNDDDIMNHEYSAY